MQEIFYSLSRRWRLFLACPALGEALGIREEVEAFSVNQGSAMGKPEPA